MESFFILVTFSVDTYISEDYLINKRYGSNYVNIDNVNNRLEGFPDLISYRMKGNGKREIQRISIKDNKSLTDIYKILYICHEQKSEEIKHYINICLGISIKESKEEGEIHLEIDIRGTNRLIKCLYFFTEVLDKKYKGGKLYCIKTKNKGRNKELILDNFKVSDIYLNNINSNGFSYISLLMEYNSKIRRSLMQYIVSRELQTIDLKGEEVKLIMSDSKPKFDKDCSIIRSVLNPSSLEDFIGNITFRSTTPKQQLIEEIGEDHYERIKEYVQEVEDNSNKVCRKYYVPFYPNIERELPTIGVNLDLVNKISRATPATQRDISEIKQRVEDKKWEESDKLNIQTIKQYIDTGELIIKDKRVYKIKGEYNEVNIWLYILSKFPLEIVNYLEANILVLGADITSNIEPNEDINISLDIKAEALNRYFEEILEKKGR